MEARINGLPFFVGTKGKTEAYAETGERSPKEVIALEMRTQQMAQRQETADPGYGVLPACAPLANPYVPYQQNAPATYPAKSGVVRGTLFPGLDLPFMGMTNDVPLDDTPLHELQALCFATAELGMYLDTHRDDLEAFELFRSYTKLQKEGMAAYEKEYGPLTVAAAAEGAAYDWLADPWPWEYEANQREA